MARTSPYRGEAGKVSSRRYLRDPRVNRGDFHLHDHEIAPGLGSWVQR